MAVLEIPLSDVKLVIEFEGEADDPDVEVLLEAIRAHGVIPESAVEIQLPGMLQKLYDLWLHERCAQVTMQIGEVGNSSSDVGKTSTELIRLYVSRSDEGAVFLDVLGEDRFHLGLQHLVGELGATKLRQTAEGLRHLRRIPEPYGPKLWLGSKLNLTMLAELVGAMDNTDFRAACLGVRRMGVERVNLIFDLARSCWEHLEEWSER